MKPTFFRNRRILAALVASWCVATAYSFDMPECLVVCSPDGTHVVAAAGQGRIQYCLASDYAVQGTFYICHPQALAFSDNGRWLVAAGGRNGSQAKIKVWRLADHRQLCEVVTVGEDFQTLALSANGQFVAGASPDGRIEVWRVSDGQSLWSRTMPKPVESIQFSRDSKRLLIQTEKGDKRSFDARRGRPFRTGRSEVSD